MERSNFPSHKAHPWHGVSPGKDLPSVVTAFIEIVPSDTIKYEIDKESGYLKIDRPQLYSNTPPALYGFIPQTYCGDQVAAISSAASQNEVRKGDGDPLDILVLCEKVIPRGDLLLQAIPVGGIRMIDKGEADDKIIAVLKDDGVYGGIRDISGVPESLVNRIRHYFMTYKLPPGITSNPVVLDDVYGVTTAHQVILASRNDYAALLGNR